MKAIQLLAPATFALSSVLHVAPNAETSPPVARTADGHHTAAPPSTEGSAVLVRTEFAGSMRERRILGCDDCGTLLYQYVNVIWLRDIFSDGTCRNYTRRLKA